MVKIWYFPFLGHGRSAFDLKWRRYSLAWLFRNYVKLTYQFPFLSFFQSLIGPIISLSLPVLIPTPKRVRPLFPFSFSFTREYREEEKAELKGAVKLPRKKPQVDTRRKSEAMSKNRIGSSGKGPFRDAQAVGGQEFLSSLEEGYFALMHRLNASLMGCRNATVLKAIYQR